MKTAIPRLIRGNVGLAEVLGVTSRSVTEWKRRGVLDAAIMVDYGRTIVYDLDKVFECLKHRKVSPGRPRKSL